MAKRNVIRDDEKPEKDEKKRFPLERQFLELWKDK